MQDSDLFNRGIAWWRVSLERMLAVLGRPASAAPPLETRRFATVLFTDIVGSTVAATRLGDSAWYRLLDGHDRTTFDVTDRHQGRVIRRTGDGVLAVFEVPSVAVACATALLQELRAIGIHIRAGLHAGEVVERPDGDLAGVAVHIAARVEEAAAPGEILVSSTVKDLLLGSDACLRAAGEHTLKGVEGRWRLYAVEPVPGSQPSDVTRSSGP